MTTPRHSSSLASRSGLPTCGIPSACAPTSTIIPTLWSLQYPCTSNVAFDQRRHESGDDWFGRPITLTKFALPDWRPGMSYASAAESPAQHRYPVWWTGRS